MNKKGFVNLVYELQDRQYTKKSITEYLDIILDGIKYVLIHGMKIKIIGFGTFNVRNRKQSESTNPQNPKEVVIVPAKKIPHFKPMRTFIDELN